MITPKLWKTLTDARDYIPEIDLIGKRFVHVNGNLYRVSGFVFDAERDLWLIEYRNDGVGEDRATFVRTVENFFGKHESGEARFREIKTPEEPKHTLRGSSAQGDNGKHF